MNFIQKAWLYALRPIAPVINDYLGKRSGLVGRFFRWIAIGPRQYGVHPINKLALLGNTVFMQLLGTITARRSFARTILRKSYLRHRRYESLVNFFMTIYLLGFVSCFLELDPFLQANQTLSFLNDALECCPYNGLDFRKSAHFTEINGYYMHEMLDLLDKKRDEIIEERSNLPDHVKAILYARPGYQYIEPHSKANNSNTVLSHSELKVTHQLVQSLKKEVH